MWTESDLLPMMQANHELFGEEITHIQAAEDTWLISYFEDRLARLFYPYYFLNNKFCQATYTGKGDLKSENLIDTGFGLTKQQCVNIGNYIIGRWYKDHWGNPQLSELTSTVVLNYIEHGYPLDETQYKIEYHPRKPWSIDDLFSEILANVAGNTKAERATAHDRAETPGAASGRWEFVNDYQSRCTACGEVSWIDHKEEHRFCPKCGAKMLSK